MENQGDSGWRGEDMAAISDDEADMCGAAAWEKRAGPDLRGCSEGPPRAPAGVTEGGGEECIVIDDDEPEHTEGGVKDGTGDCGRNDEAGGGGGGEEEDVDDDVVWCGDSDGDTWAWDRGGGGEDGWDGDDGGWEAGSEGYDGNCEPREAARPAATGDDAGGRGAMIVYAPTRDAVEEIAARLAGLGHSAAAYHAGLGEGRKLEVHMGFLRGSIAVVVATVAFGMGINKAPPHTHRLSLSLCLSPPHSSAPHSTLSLSLSLRRTPNPYVNIASMRDRHQQGTGVGKLRLIP